MITDNVIRNGNFTSSDAVKLTGFAVNKKDPGKAFFTYIRKKNQERKLGRTIEVETNAKPFSWGHLLEPIAFDHVDTSYKLQSDITLQHPTIPFWTGSPDGFRFGDNQAVIDFKAPITLDSFCDLVDPLYEGKTGIDAINAIRNIHSDGDKYYWQLVSNTCISNSKFAELIIYMPYLSEIPLIKLSADGIPNCYWIAMASDKELPYLIDGGFYKNINIIRFEVPQSDKDFLTNRIELAGEHLIEL